MDVNDLHDLLTQVGEIHQQAEQQRRNSGDRFNVFSVLRKPHDEVGLHSSFLHYLLDPKGKHDQGAVFLQAFLDQVGLTLSGDLSLAQAYREQDNIDVLLRSRTEAIVIENKIYAMDQKNQLQRYHEKLIGKGVELSNITLVYLTLDGHIPQDIGGLKGKQLELISYADHILPWLDECIQLMALKPRIRETLSQYQDIVRRLTNQMGTQAEVDSIAQILLQDNNYAKARLIQQAMFTAKVAVHHWFWPNLERVLCSRGLLLYPEYTRYDDEMYKSFLRKENKKAMPRLAFKVAEYDGKHLIMTLGCVRAEVTFGVKCQLVDPKNNTACHPASFQDLSKQALKMVPASTESKHSLATTHEWMGLDMRYFSDDESSNFFAMDARQQVGALERLVDELVPVYEKLKEIDLSV